jgi:hypothetical protein
MRDVVCESSRQSHWPCARTWSLLSIAPDGLLAGAVQRNRTNRFCLHDGEFRRAPRVPQELEPGRSHSRFRIDNRNTPVPLERSLDLNPASDVRPGLTVAGIQPEGSAQPVRITGRSRARGSTHGAGHYVPGAVAEAVLMAIGANRPREAGHASSHRDAGVSACIRAWCRRTAGCLCHNAGSEATEDDDQYWGISPPHGDLRCAVQIRAEQWMDMAVGTVSQPVPEFWSMDGDYFCGVARRRDC